MKFLSAIFSRLVPQRGPDSEGRVKCVKCSRRVQANIAADNAGLCGVCHRRRKPRVQTTSDKPSPYHQKLTTPVAELSDDDKRLQLSGSISWKNEERIDELLAGDRTFMDKPYKYASRTWLSTAIHCGCNLSIIKKIHAAGGDVNGRLTKSGCDYSTPLEVAVSKDRLDVMEWLLANGANPNLGRPIIGVVVQSKPAELQLQMLKLLVDGGVDVNQSFDLFGNQQARFTALDWAESNRLNPEVLEFLKAQGAQKYSKPSRP